MMHSAVITINTLCSTWQYTGFMLVKTQHLLPGASLRTSCIFTNLCNSLQLFAVFANMSKHARTAHYWVLLICVSHATTLFQHNTCVLCTKFVYCRGLIFTAWAISLIGYDDIVVKEVIADCPNDTAKNTLNWIRSTRLLYGETA